MPLTLEEVLKSVFKKTIEDVLNEREQRIKTDDDKQDALESGVNIKTVNNQSILGAGNIDIAGAVNVYEVQTGDITPTSEISTGEWVVQLSPTMLSVLSEFKKRIDFTDPSVYGHVEDYIACEPAVQYTLENEHFAWKYYIYQTILAPEFEFHYVFFLHVTKENDVAVDYWKFVVVSMDLATKDYVGMFCSSYYMATQNSSGLMSGFHEGTTDNDIGGVFARNTVVAVADWQADNTYADYPYRAEISIMASHGDSAFEVVFDVPEATSGNYAPVCDYDPTHETLTIWAKEVPVQAITIPLIKEIL